jgi:hypothetical protein
VCSSISLLISCFVLLVFQYWGEQGWFRVARGKNNILIESNCAWAVPGSWTDIHSQSPVTPPIHPRNYGAELSGNRGSRHSVPLVAAE